MTPNGVPWIQTPSPLCGHKSRKEPLPRSWLANITSLTNPEALQKLSRFSVEEDSRLALLEKSLLDLQANDPEKLIQQLTVGAGRAHAVGPACQRRGSGTFDGDR